MPITGDCVVEGQYTLTFDEFGMSGGRQSDHQLFVHGGANGGGWVNLGQGEYRFSGGTTIAGTSLVVWDTLLSDVRILRDYTGLGFNGESEFWLLGTVKGNVVNEQLMNVRCWSGIHSCSNIPHQRIDGNYTQLPQGTLEMVLGRGLQITGLATLDGDLRLTRGDANYVLPNAPGNILVLHADGGVTGQFARWNTQSLFLEGALRYMSNDVFFDATRISLQAATAAQGMSGTTLVSAGNVDRALAVADGFASAPNAVQSRFLQSAGRLLWIGDAQQAARSLDSLAGSLHVEAMDALARDDGLARGIGARALALQPGGHAGAWSRLQGDGTIAGFDQWLSPRLLVGATASEASGLATDALGGQTQHDSPQAALYLRWFGDDGWYAGGSAGYARHALGLDRRIDLADGGNWNAHAQRRLGIASLDAEAGRRFAFAGMAIAPYAWMGADLLRSERARELGQTGFELALQANRQARLEAGLGLRVGRQWRFGDTGWVALDADARYRRRLAQAGDPLRAAFVGVPDAWFDLSAHEARVGTWLELGLHGGFGHGWGWSLGHAGSLTDANGQRHWQFGLQRRF